LSLPPLAVLVLAFSLRLSLFLADVACHRCQLAAVCCCLLLLLITIVTICLIVTYCSCCVVVVR
jgi:hypothetical protein